MVKRIKPNQAETVKDYVLKPKEKAAIQKPASGIANNTTPGLKVKNGRVEIDHPDKVIGMLLMMDEFATSDPAFMYGILRQIGAAVCDGHRAASENDANFVLSVIKAQKPRNETETMLAAHKAITNLGAMNAARLRKNATSLEELELVDGIYHKSTKSLLALSEGVKRLQSSGEPSVTVHQNVSVTDGGQAIVGNVTQNPSAAAPATVASLRAITDARIVPMPIIETRAPEVVVPFKPNSKK